MRALTESPRYEKFIRERDLVLEDILLKYYRAFDAILDTLKLRAQEIASHMRTVGTEDLLRRDRAQFQARLKPWFDMAAQQSLSLIQRMRQVVYGLSYAGQAEGMGRALGEKTHGTPILDDLVVHLRKEMPSGGSVAARVELAYNRLINNVIESYHLSQVVSASPQESLDRIARAFPKSAKVKSIRKVIAPMREADTGFAIKQEGQKEFDYYDGDIPDYLWREILEDYQRDYLPGGRGPWDSVFYSQVDETGEEGEYFKYQWELESELTNDFIQGVRSGENDAARENGIEEFSWISIVDTKTDECCLWRDGLTTKEIEEQLDSDHSDDECDAVAAPAHLNCRCRMSPMVQDFPEETPPDFGAFDDWLEMRAKEAS